MKCPRCGSLKTKVIDSRKRNGLTRRARSCEDCYKWFYTVEILEDEYKELKERGDTEYVKNQADATSGRST